MDSTRSHLKKEQGFLISSVNYGDDHRILSFFTKGRGRIDMIALGAKKSQKRFGGKLDYLNQLQLQYRIKPHSGADNRLGHLQEVELLQSFPDLRKDYERLMMALEWCRMLAKVLHREEALPKLFEAFLEGLHALEFFKQASVADLSFRYQALSSLGYELNQGPFTSSELWSLKQEPVWSSKDFQAAKKLLDQAYQECLSLP